MRNFWILLLPVFFAAACTSGAKTTSAPAPNATSNAAVSDAPKIAVKLDSTQIWDGKKVQKMEEEYRQILSEEAYRVLREKGTERAYTSALYELKKAGVYSCAACGLPLFSSETKFNSGTGWPSFYAPIHATHVGEIVDRSHGMVRTEVVCNRCGGHLGHVFDDGPKPTGLRYCINGVSLQFSESK